MTIYDNLFKVAERLLDKYGYDVLIEKPTRTRISSGGYTEIWATVATVKGVFASKSGIQNLEQEQVRSRSSYMLYFKYTDDENLYNIHKQGQLRVTYNGMIGQAISASLHGDQVLVEMEVEFGGP